MVLLKGSIKVKYVDSLSNFTINYTSESTALALRKFFYGELSKHRLYQLDNNMDPKDNTSWPLYECKCVVCVGMCVCKDLCMGRMCVCKNACV